jgi:transcriptional regulator with GAF, ATPase, and Fis domain
LSLRGARLHDPDAMLGPDGTISDGRMADALRDLTDLSLEAHEGRLIDEALRRAGGDVGEAARLLGLTRRQIDYRLKAREG